MARTLSHSPSLLDRWRGALGRRESARPDRSDALRDLVSSLETATGVGLRLTEQIQASSEGQPLANAASVCRWELLILRERVLGLDVEPQYRSVRSQVARELDGAATAARVLSAGYRLHSLDRICDGGEALDDRLEALARIRSRLAGH